MSGLGAIALLVGSLLGAWVLGLLVGCELGGRVVRRRRGRRLELPRALIVDPPRARRLTDEELERARHEIDVAEALEARARELWPMKGDRR